MSKKRDTISSTSIKTETRTDRAKYIDIWDTATRNGWFVGKIVREFDYRMTRPCDGKLCFSGYHGDIFYDEDKLLDYQNGLENSSKELTGGDNREESALKRQFDFFAQTYEPGGWMKSELRSWHELIIERDQNSKRHLPTLNIVPPDITEYNLHTTYQIGKWAKMLEIDMHRRIFFEQKEDITPHHVQRFSQMMQLCHNSLEIIADSYAKMDQQTQIAFAKNIGAPEENIDFFYTEHPTDFFPYFVFYGLLWSEFHKSPSTENVKRFSKDLSLNIQSAVKEGQFISEYRKWVNEEGPYGNARFHTCGHGNPHFISIFKKDSWYLEGTIPPIIFDSSGNPHLDLEVVSNKSPNYHRLCDKNYLIRVDELLKKM